MHFILAIMDLADTKKLQIARIPACSTRRHLFFLS
jgi:hypothetical protein